jgi:hypothetical protein
VKEDALQHVATARGATKKRGVEDAENSEERERERESEGMASIWVIEVVPGLRPTRSMACFVWPF